MGSAVLPARRRAAVSIWTVAPTAVALAFGLAFHVLEPRPGDLAVHVFRAELFGREESRSGTGGNDIVCGGSGNDRIGGG